MDRTDGTRCRSWICGRAGMELSRSALLKAITTEWPDETKLPELLFGSEDSDA